MKLQVATVQHPPVFLNLAASVERALTLIAEAAAKGARVIAFPETWLPGYPLWLDDAPGAGLWDHPPAKQLFQVLCDNALRVPGPEVDQLQKAAKRASAHVVMGAHERRGGTLYNTMLFFPPDGGVPALHRKLMPTYTERLVWGRGDGSTLDAVQTEWGALGGLICWEHWMPLARAAMHARGEALHVAQWPQVKLLNLLCSRHYAFEGQCFVLGTGAALRKGEVLEGFDSLKVQAPAARELLASMPGDPDVWVLRGGSAVIAPDAACVAGPLDPVAQTLHAELDLDRITQGHLALDAAGHYARPDVFELRVNTRPQQGVRFEDAPPAAP